MRLPILPNHSPKLSLSLSQSWIHCLDQHQQMLSPTTQVPSFPVELHWLV